MENHINKKRARGVTIIELIMVIVIVGLITAVSGMYIKETVDLWRFLSFRNELVNEGRMALMKMAREIRQIKNHSSISVANSSQITFTDINNHVISYQLSNGNLVRTYDGVSNTLADRVTALTFIYYNSANAVLTPLPLDSSSRANIYRLDVSFTMRAGSQTKILNTQVYPRNL
ncbi:MAG: prepilin-type N-terminal cleavage/methylation domain-containing protein [Candidatus Omnitrophica bacterium]|nr:prepilin-type N-terminal cleavage/methylation domain-containing protein [Candidatus Omnitrophota bacterium]